MPETLYDVLDVAPDADVKAVKAAYRRKAKALHPDRNPGDEGKVNQFRAVADAFAVLSDPARRAHYDATGDPSNAPDLRRQLQAQRLYGCLVEAVASACERGEDPKRLDVPAAMRRLLSEQAGAASRNRADADASAANWDDLAGRFEGKEGKPPPPEAELLRSLARQRAKECRDAALACEQELDLIDECLKAIKGVGWRREGNDQLAAARWMGMPVTVAWKVT